MTDYRRCFAFVATEPEKAEFGSAPLTSHGQEEPLILTVGEAHGPVRRRTLPQPLVTAIDMMRQVDIPSFPIGRQNLLEQFFAPVRIEFRSHPSARPHSGGPRRQRRRRRTGAGPGRAPVVRVSLAACV